MRKIFLIGLLVSPLIHFAQFDLTNQFGIGVNVPVLIAVRDYPPIPMVQLDFSHEMYFKTRDPNIVKSTELRIGAGAMYLGSTYLYMFNLGLQKSLVETDYLHAVGVDLIGYMVQVPRAFADRIFGIAGVGKGNGAGVGVFYKFGRRLSSHWSITTEIGGMVTMDYYEATFYGPVVWKSAYTPNLGLYRGNISLNYHFGQ